MFLKDYIKRVQKVRGHLTSGQKAKKQSKKTWKKHVFLVFFFTFALIEANVTRDEICTFSMFWGTCCKKKHDYLHFFWYFFHFLPHFTQQKMYDKFKKSAFFGILPYITQQKSCFQHLFCIFWTKKFSIFNFPPHYKKFHFYFFLCSSYGKQLKKRQKSWLFFYSEKFQ